MCVGGGGGGRGGGSVAGNFVCVGGKGKFSGNQDVNPTTFKSRYIAKVREVDADKVLVHFDGWSSRHDEYVMLSSGRLRSLPPGAATQGKKKEKVVDHLATLFFCSIAVVIVIYIHLINTGLITGILIC